MIDANKHFRMVIYLVYYGPYDDMFEIFLKQYKKNWADCPYPLVIANPKYHPNPEENIITLDVPENAKGIERKNIILDTINADYYLGFEVDRVIMHPVDNTEIEKILDFMDENRIRYFRCNPSFFKKKENDKFSGFEHYYHIPAKEPYGVCGSTIIWSKELLDERRGSSIEGGYDWESYHLKRAASTKDKWIDGFATDDRNVFHILHCIEKQEWIRKSKRILEKEGYNFDESRKAQTISKTIEANLKGASKRIPGRIRFVIKKGLTRLGFKFTTKY